MKDTKIQGYKNTKIKDTKIQFIDKFVKSRSKI